jgi:hypothetical protein
MHRALYIQEVVENIVGCLSAAGAGGHRIALLSLACTCRILSKPALDVIWEYCCAWHLAQTMDKDVWTVTTREVPRTERNRSEIVHIMVSTARILKIQVQFA